MVEGPPQLQWGDEGVAQLVLNRPSHLNRLQREDLGVLQAHLEHLRAEPGVRVLVLTGTGRAFSAGYNLQELRQGAGSAQADPELFGRTVDALEALPIPTIARLNGSVWGGATDLALACDFRVGVQGMQLRMPAAQLGLHYYANGLQRYLSRLGLQAAKRLFLTAQTLSDTELLQIGYLDQLVSPQDLDSAVATYTQALLAAAPLAVQGMKQSLNELAAGRSSPELLRQRQARCEASEDLREGLAAMAQRRAPRFVGR